MMFSSGPGGQMVKGHGFLVGLLAFWSVRLHPAPCMSATLQLPGSWGPGPGPQLVQLAEASVMANGP